MVTPDPTVGTLGHLTQDEERKLQQAWVHLLRLCGVEGLEKVGAPTPVPDLSKQLSRELSDVSQQDFRGHLWGFILAEHPDALVLRFLRARKWDVESAMMMLVSAITWRADRRMLDTVIRVGEAVALKEGKEQTADDKAFITQYQSGKSYVRGKDKENRIIYNIHVRLHDPRAQTPYCMEEYVLHNIESLRVLIKPPNDKCCLIFDMTGFGLKNMDFHVVRFLVSVFEARYPETLGLVLIHNAPFVFWGIWNIIKGWLDPVIASKINFTRKTKDMLQFISEENLGKGYGGKDTWDYEYVKPVPGENARLQEDEKRAEINHEHNELISQFETETVAWASLDAESSEAKDKATERTKLADQLTDSYWKLDPYIRSTTLLRRLGMVDEIAND
ncbi:CRAL/TRIO domain-containing protein [Xylariaceae sp. FL0255]|nr:CRAL/TRIO domain-containing protein [Xylariaceae sp. FL0255]